MTDLEKYLGFPKSRETISRESYGISSISMLANRNMANINLYFPEYLGPAMEQWLMTYNSEMCDGKHTEHESAKIANQELELFYRSLWGNDEDIEEYENKEWDGVLKNMEESEMINREDLPGHQEKEVYEEKKIDVKKIFDEIDSRYPEYSIEARELRNREYENQRSPNIPDTHIDTGAMRSADRRLESFYEGIKAGNEYIESKDKEGDDGEVYPETIEDAIETYLPPVMEKIKEEYPEYVDEAKDFWSYHLERMRDERKDLREDDLAKRSAERRLEYFYQKLSE